MNATVTKLRSATDNVSSQSKRKPAKAATRRLRQQALAATAICTVACSVVALSLTHLAHGIALVTNAPSVEAWALAVGIDLGFVALELATMAAATDKLRRQIERYTRPAIVGTLAGSAILNAFAFASGASGYCMQGAAAVLGLSIPALVYALTRVGATMWIDRRNAS